MGSLFPKVLYLGQAPKFPQAFAIFGSQVLAVLACGRVSLLPLTLQISLIF